MSAALEQREVPSKHDEHLKKSASIDREISSPKGKSNKADSNGMDSSRDGTPVDQRHRSPSSGTKEAAAALVQMHNAATPPLSKTNSQSPKSKPSTPVSEKRSESIDGFDSLSTSSPKQKNNRDDKRGGFRTDREYLNEKHADDSAHDLEEWQPDEEDNYDPNEVQSRNSKGWTPAEMFLANDRLGVQSSYAGIEEYCTAKPEGDEEARKRADKIAAEIERNKDSQHASLLENDDYEQDLDKETRFDDREGGGRGPKRQSGYQKDNRRSQFNSGGSGVSNSGGRNYSNSPRNSYPNTGSAGQSTNAGSNRYGNSNARQQQQPPRGSYSSNYSSASNVPSRQTAPTSTSWRESPQQSNYAKTAKSPSLHSEERRQSASPATSKYSTDSSTTTASVRRTNSVQNRQQQPEYPANKQQEAYRVPENQYHDGSSSSSSIPPQTASPQQVEIQPLITPIPKSTPQSQNQYDNQQQQYNSQMEKEDSKKKFSFNPDAAVFVPKTPKPASTPVPNQSMPMQIGIPQHVPLMSQHQIPPQQITALQNVQSYNSQMLPIGMQVSMPNMMYQMPIQQQQRYPETAYVDNGGKMIDPQQQQKYMAQIQRGAPTVQQIQYVQQQPQQYTQQQHNQIMAQIMPTQMVPHPQLTGQIAYAPNPTGNLPYQHAPPLPQPQQLMYQYGYANGQ